MTMDIFSIKAAPKELELVHPKTKEPTGAYLTLLSKDSKEYEKLIRMQAQAAILARESGDTRTDLVKNRKETLETIASLIQDWRPDESFGGPFTKELAINLISEPERNWVTEQIWSFVDKRENFITG